MHSGTRQTPCLCINFNIFLLQKILFYLHGFICRGKHKQCFSNIKNFICTIILHLTSLLTLSNLSFLKQRVERKARHSSGSPILITTRVAVTLCWLAGASHLDLWFAPGISSSTLYSRRGALWPTIKAINLAFKVDCWMDVS